jgi:hypothetical protein
VERAAVCVVPQQRVRSTASCAAVKETNIIVQYRLIHIPRAGMQLLRAGSALCGTRCISVTSHSTQN